MKFRVIPCLLAFALPMAPLASGETPAPAATPAPGAPPAPGASPTPGATPVATPSHKSIVRPKESFMHRLTHPFENSKGDKAADKNAPGVGNTTLTGYKELAIGMQVDPTPLKVAEVRQVKVTLTIVNRGTKLVQLEFPTSQRIEVLIKGAEGKMVEQWSEDQAFTNEPTMVTINPGERLEYTANVATRDLVAGQTYSVEAFFPNFEQLRQSRNLPTVSATPAGTPAPKVTPAPAPTPKKKKK